jgi:hypothetical protein
MDSNLSLVYLAKPIYGGWVTYTAHLVLKYGFSLYKVTKRSEKTTRNFGYGINYKNVSIEDLLQIPNLCIVAIDKHYWDLLHKFPSTTKIVIHDPTELKLSKNINPLIQGEKLLHNFKVFTIREKVQSFLKDYYSIDSTLSKHPFHQYETNVEPHTSRAISISRIDFDKNIDIILNANKLIKNKENKIQIFGAENRIYVHHKLADLDFYSYWKGKFEKSYPLSYQGKDILKGARYVIDLSTIKNDGGGTQYTFLEAIYQDCVLILHREWVNKGELFKEGINCLAVNNEKELSDILNSNIDVSKLIKESKKILNDHI